MIVNPATIGPGGVHGVRADGGGMIFRTFSSATRPKAR
jgi:hypothetical protein